jgi:hypothetical protein
MIRQEQVKSKAATFAIAIRSSCPLNTGLITIATLVRTKKDNETRDEATHKRRLIAFVGAGDS